MVKHAHKHFRKSNSLQTTQTKTENKSKIRGKPEKQELVEKKKIYRFDLISVIIIITNYYIVIVIIIVINV